MKKRGVKLVVSILVLVFISLSGVLAFSFEDDFQSYALGKNTTQPVWIPQYSDRVEIMQQENEKFLYIDSFSSFGGDRDVHVAFNKDFLKSSVDFLSLQWDYYVESCNSTWKYAEGVSPQGASTYIFYNNSDNFISVEFKINANSSYCGDGIAQISAYKRINGTSFPVIPYTTFPFQMKTKYTAKVVIERVNSRYNLSAYLNNELKASSINLSYYEIENGKILLENGGAKTRFDNVFIFSSKTCPNSSGKCRKKFSPRILSSLS